MDFGSEVEDDEGYLSEQKGEDEEKKEDDSYEDSELEEEKEESIWDDINWSEDMHGEREKTIWNDINWSEDMHGEREKTIWDDIDWSEDAHGEGEKNEEAKNEEQNDEYNKEDYIENVESQSTSTVLTNKIEEIEIEHQEQKEQIEIHSEEYQDEMEPIVNTDEIEFIKDVEKLAEHAREIKAEDEIIEPQTEKENAAYYAEQYYETLKEKEAANDQDSKEGQETEEVRQEVAEELKGDQESGYNIDKLEEEDNVEASKITSTEEFEYLWEVRDKLDQEGKTSEEIEEVMHEAEQMYETLKDAEKIIEELELEKLKLVDHEDDASEEDLKEVLDRVDLIEQAVELEEDLIQQGESQEEIDARVEKAIEEVLEEKEVENYENVEDKEIEVLKPELDAIESESEDNKDLLEEDTKLGSEESDEEETERLRELYRQEAGRRPIYARKKTIGYIQWLEQRELGAEKIKNSKGEREKTKEIKEEDWNSTLNKWIKEASEEECNAEFKSELKKALESYNEFEDLTRKFMELCEKSQNEKLSEKEKDRLKSLTGRLKELDPIQLELLTSVFFIKKYITEQYWGDFWSQHLVNRVLSKFFKHISQKYKLMKQEILKLKELINANEDIIPEEKESLVNNEIDNKKSLKYPFNKKDNDTTKLIKIILNQIYKNKRALEKYHFGQKDKNKFTFLKGKDIFYPNQKSPSSLSQYNISIFFGISRSKARNWIIKLDQNRNIELPDLEFRKIRATILRYLKGEGEDIIRSRQIIKSAIKIYIEKNYNNIDFITKIVLFLDDCVIWEKTGQSPSLLSISKCIGMNPNYLLEIKNRLKNTKSDQYSKYFTLSTNILLLKYRDFKFKSIISYENFKKGALDIIFQEMVRQGIFSNENAEIMKRQYKALVYILYALTKARNKRFSLSKLSSISNGRDNKGIYTLTDLSRKIGGRKLFADYLLYETFISRETLAEIKNLLERNKVYADIECEFALNLLDKIPRIRLGQRSSYIGRQSHPILENFFRKLWLKLGIISKHEYQFNYPNSLHRIDSALEISTQQKLIDLLKSSSDSSLSKFKTLFIDYTIPNLVRFNVCVLNKISPEKKYLAKNRSVILVFYGTYSEKIFKTLQMKLNFLNLDNKKNIRFMDITKFIQLFTNNADDLRELDEINTLIKKALDDSNKEALEELDRKADEALFDLSKYSK